MRKQIVIGAAVVLAVVVLTSITRTHFRANAAIQAHKTEVVPSHAPIVRADSTPQIKLPGSSIKPQVFHGQREQILEARLQTLDAETTEGSVQRLDQALEYFSPGPIEFLNANTHNGAAVLRRESEQFLVDAVLGNRRFLKVLESLAKMPKDDAGRLVADAIHATLPRYQKDMDAEIARCRQWLAEGKTVGLGMDMGNKPDGTPTLEGERLDLIALALLAGTLELPAARDAILDLTHAALLQRNDIANPSFLSPAYREGLVHFDTIYSSRALATALVGTSATGSHAAALDPSQADQWSQVTLPMYNAKTTAFETPARSLNTPYGVDYTKGRQVIFIHEPMRDFYFDKLIMEQK